MARKSDQITSRLRFSIIPEWVLDADVSDRAVRLYALLARYADSETQQCFPARRTLARRMHCSVDSVDRAMAELVDLGAVAKQRQDGPAGDQTSNLYTLCPDCDPAAEPRPPGREAAATPGREAAAQNENHLEREPEKEPEPDGSPSEPPQETRAREERPTTEAFTIAKNAIAKTGLRRNTQIVARAVQQQIDAGNPPEDLLGAVGHLERGMEITPGTLGVALTKYRQARTREREREERERMGSSDLPYVLGPGKGGDTTNYDLLA